MRFDDTPCSAVFLTIIVLTAVSYVIVLTDTGLQIGHSNTAEFKRRPSDQKQSNESRRDLRHCSNRARLRHLRKVCISSPELNDDADWTDRRFYQPLLVDDRNHIMYCSISKVACTTFKTMMYLQVAPSLNGHLSFGKMHTNSYLVKHGLRRLSSYPLDDILYKLREYSKLLVVRHPLERLISAYQDKFVKTNYAIKKAIKGNVTIDGGRNGYFEMTDFLNMLAAAIEKRSTDVINYLDKHWERQYLRCNPCSINYDYVAKLETIDSDMDYILRFFGQTEVPHRNAASSPKGNNASRITVAELLNTVNKDVIRVLTDYYKYDFELFSYKVNITRDSDGKYVETGEGMC